MSVVHTKYLSYLGKILPLDVRLSQENKTHLLEFHTNAATVGKSAPGPWICEQ